MKTSLSLLATLIVGFVAAAASASDKPNIVYILVDNMGWGDISVQGSTTPTPRIDALAAQGVRLTNFNIQNQCTPTRSAIHTGRLPVRTGTQKVAAPGEPDGLAPWEYTIAELLSDGGYATALYGKWHIGSRLGRMPNDQGYDEWWGINGGSNAAGYTSTSQFDPNVAAVPHFWTGLSGKPSTPTEPYDIPGKAMMDTRSTAKTIDFIKKNAAARKPFFAYVGFSHFHPPLVVHPDFENKSNAGIYADTQMEVDHNVGRILDALEAAGVEDNTVVILSGDNGAGNSVSARSANAPVMGSNAHWRGGLSTAYEGGMRTPAMIRWPGRIASRLGQR